MIKVDQKGVVVQAETLKHRKLCRLRTVVVSVADKDSLKAG